MDPAFRSRFGSDSINVMRRVVAQAQELFYLPSLATRLIKLVLVIVIVLVKEEGLCVVVFVQSIKLLMSYELGLIVLLHSSLANR